MDDRKLQVFFSVIKNGSFSKAAAEQNCTQSAVTQMMNSLDQELGFPLLKRSHNGTKLTPEGEKLLPYLVEAAGSFKKLAEQATSLHEGKTRYIRIGAFASIAESWLPKMLASYQEAHPAITFDLKISTQNLTEWLDKGEIDIALGDEIRCRSSRWIPLTDDPYVAVVPASMVKPGQKSISHGELASFTMIVSPQNVLAPYFNLLIKKQLFISSDADAPLFALVAGGVGVSVIPRLSVHNLPDNVRILELIPTPKRHLGIAISDTASQTAINFASYIKRQYAKL